MSSGLEKPTTSKRIEGQTNGSDRKSESERNLEIPVVHGLTDRQLAACDYALSGMSMKEIAAKVGVARETIWRWFNRNALLRTHMERLRLEAHQARVDRGWVVHDKAMEIIDSALDEGDVPTAIAVVRLPRFTATLPEEAHMPELKEPDLSGKDVTPPTE
jgi:AcrR family transcriptional regulator